MPPRTRAMLKELQQWCDTEPSRGRRTKVAQALRVKRQAITDWFAERQEPTGEQVLAIQEFLAKQRRKSGE